jgi:hypothetical protein
MTSAAYTYASLSMASLRLRRLTVSDFNLRLGNLGVDKTS